MKKLYGGAINAIDKDGLRKSIAFTVTFGCGADVEKVVKEMAYEKFPENQGYSQHYWVYIEASPSQINDVQYGIHIHL